MPTYSVEQTFWTDFDRLTPQLQERFRAARNALWNDLQTRSFRPGLRVKKMAGVDIWEMTFAPDGRATFQYGSEVVPGQLHIIWRRIGSHDIFRNP